MDFIVDEISLEFLLLLCASFFAKSLFSLLFVYLTYSTNEFLFCLFTLCFLKCFKGYMNHEIDFYSRSSITRLSVDDKVQRSKDVSSQERDLLHKTIVERKGELESPDVEVKPFTKDDNNQTSRALPGYSPPHLEEKTNRKTLTVVNADGELEEIHPWRRPASLRVRSTFNSENTSSGNKLSPAGIKEEDDVQLRRVHSFESDEK